MSIIAVGLIIIIATSFLSHKLKQQKLAVVQMLQSNYLDDTEFVDDYVASGDSVTIYVNKLWLTASDKEHIKWCDALDSKLTAIYHDRFPDDKFGVYLHVYIHNDNGTVTQLAYCRGYSGTELYYKH